MELFKILENTTMNPNDWEKLTIMYNVLPKEIQNVINFSASISPKEFYHDIKNKVSVKGRVMRRNDKSAIQENKKRNKICFIKISLLVLKNFKKNYNILINQA